MYRIIGGDRQQYGPVTADQLREWIANGRANGQTMVQLEGETDWKPLSEFEEFAEALAAKPPPPTDLPVAPAAPPMASDAEADRVAQEAIARDYTVEIGSCLGRAWDLMKSDFWPIVGITALILVLTGSAGGLLNGPLLGGLFCYYLKKIRREPASLNDAFAGFSGTFLPLFLGAIVSGLLIWLGFIACIIPGIYLAVAWQMALPLIIDKRIDFWPAMEVSRKVMSAHWWSVALFLIVCALINFAGALVCGIGIFVTWPLTMLALAFLYDDLFGTGK